MIRSKIRARLKVSCSINVNRYLAKQDAGVGTDPSSAKIEQVHSNWERIALRKGLATLGTLSYANHCDTTRKFKESVKNIKPRKCSHELATVAPQRARRCCQRCAVTYSCQWRKEIHVLRNKYTSIYVTNYSHYYKIYTLITSRIWTYCT